MEKLLNHLIGGAVGGFILGVILAGSSISPGILVLLKAVTGMNQILMTVIYGLVAGLIISLVFMFLGKTIPVKQDLFRYVIFGLIWWILLSILPSLFLGIDNMNLLISLIGWVVYGLILGYLSEYLE